MILKLNLNKKKVQRVWRWNNSLIIIKCFNDLWSVKILIEIFVVFNFERQYSKYLIMINNFLS